MVKKAIEKTSVETVLSPKLGDEINLEQLREQSILRARMVTDTNGKRPISPNANGSALSAMHLSSTVEQNEYIITLLEQILFTLSEQS